MAPKQRRKRKIDQVRVRKVLQEAARRADSTEETYFTQVAEDLLEGLTEVQRDFVTDPSSQKAALCTRRAGKTWACKIALLYTAITQAYSTNVYINTSRRECRNILWKGKDGLKALNKKYKLGGITNETYMELELPNGSVIRLVGVDDSAEMEKLRGDAYDLVVVDESAKLDSLEYFAQDILFPALGDRMGTIALIGTPSIACSGYFFKITKDSPDVAGWTVHRWTYKDNITLPHLAEVNARLKKNNGWKDDHPTWLREYCGKWVKSADLLVYAFNQVPEEDRYHDGLPEGLDPDGKPYPLHWDYILGLDLGYRDAFAYSVWAYSNNHPVAYEMESFKESKLHDGKQSDIVLDLMKRYDFSKIVIDGSPATIEAWRERLGIPGERAEKQHKHSYIDQVNGAMLTGQVRFRRGSVLATEMSSLQWKENTLQSAKPVEDKANTPNDICDAALYAWKELLNWAWTATKFSPGKGTDLYYQQLEIEDEERACGLHNEASSYFELLT